MIKTDNFVKTLLDKGLADDVLTLNNGYDIQYKGNIVSVRLNGKGSALIYNQRKNQMIEVCSGRLDNVLHRYIVQSLFGLQTKVGTKNNTYDNVLFVPMKVVKNCVVFEDTCGRRFTVKDSSPEAVLSYYDEARAVNADDTILLLSGFTPYDSTVRENSKVESSDVELQLLKCSVNLDDYSVSPRSSQIADVGKTLVGNFLCSSADKVNQITFEEDEKKAFAFSSADRREISSSTIRTRNPFASEAKQILNSVDGRKKIADYIDSKYPNGLCVSALEQVMAYETPSILKEVGKVHYGEIYSSYLKKANAVQFRLDTNKSILSCISSDTNVSKFRAIPDLAAIRNGLRGYGYLLTELENGLEFRADDPAITVIFSNCRDFTPVTEDVLNQPNSVKKVIGSECRKTLNDEYGIDDEKGVFNSFVRIIVN